MGFAGNQEKEDYTLKPDSTNNETLTPRKRPTAAFIAVVVISFALYYLMNALQPHLTGHLIDYDTWLANMKDSALWGFLWLIGDATEPYFFKSILGGFGVLIGSIIAYILDRKQSKYRLSPLCGGYGKIWPWIFAASFLSQSLALLLFGSVRVENFVPTFVPYVSVAGAIVFLYGGRLEVALTAAVLGAVFTTPVAMYLRTVVLIPAGLHGMEGNVAAMWVGGIFAFEICRFLPWMKRQPLTELSPSKVEGETNGAECMIKTPNKYFFRRILADYSEPMFVGNEYAGAFLLLGTVLSWLLDPYHPVYSTGELPGVLCSELLVSALAIYIYWDQWVEKKFFPTFVPIVSVTPAMVLFFGPSLVNIVLAAVLGAVLCPPFAQFVNERIPSHWHKMVGFTVSMTFCTIGITLFLKYLYLAFPFLLA